MEPLATDIPTNEIATNGHGGRAAAFATDPAERAGLDLAILLPERSGSGVSVEGRPEVAQMTFGILPLVDCAPIVVAHAKGFFAKHGIQAGISKLTSWTALRDALNTGEVHAAHMLFGMPVGAAVGKLGADQKPLIIPGS